MENIFSTISSSIVAVGLFLSSLFGQVEKPKDVGASIPISVAVFQTSLATKIATTDTSMTLVLGTNKAGNALSGYTCFNVDEGTAVEEFVCGTASGTAVTAMRRGLDPVDGYTEVTALKKAHGRGASVKITNFPQIAITSRLLNGQDSIPNAMFYGSTLTFSSSTQIVTKGYVDGVAIAGGANATTLVKGIGAVSVAPASSTFPIFVGDNDTRIPSAGQAAALAGSSSTPSATNKYITQSDVATTTTANAIVRASSTGKIDSTFLNSADIQTFTASGTWTKVSQAKKILIQGWGAGGSGGGGATTAGGGGGGAYKELWLDASSIGATSSVTVGAGGAASATNGNAGGNTLFGTSTFIVYGGGAGATSGGGGGGGGSKSAGSSATSSLGQPGGSPLGGSAGADSAMGGGGGGTSASGTSTQTFPGGTSYFGGNGGGGSNTNFPAVGAGGLGGNGGAYGSGSAGASGTSTAGTNGALIVTTFF